MGFDFIILVLILLSPYDFSFVFGYRVSFFGRFQCFILNGYSAISCDFSVFMSRDELTSFCSAILSQPSIRNVSFFINIFMPSRFCVILRKAFLDSAFVFLGFVVVFNPPIPETYMVFKKYTHLKLLPI